MSDELRRDEERYSEIASALVDAVDAVIADWVSRLVIERATKTPTEMTEQLRREADAAGERARAEAVPELRDLVMTDIDAQAANPLAILRTATRHAHEALITLDTSPVERDRFAEEAFPEDAYGLVPATWADIHPSLQEPGIAWGAAKAYLHRARRRDEGRL